MEFRNEFRVAMQRALWGMITPSVRAIAMGWADGIGHARFIFDDVPGEDEQELVDEVETEVMADFPETAKFDFTTDFQLTDRLAFEPGESWWAYVRREARD
jgi:hypothetical protein